MNIQDLCKENAGYSSAGDVRVLMVFEMGSRERATCGCSELVVRPSRVLLSAAQVQNQS
jgi:hypothetical protein